MAKAKYDGRKNLIPVHDHETAIIARWEKLTRQKAIKIEG